MNVYWHEWRAYRKSTIIWTITLVAFLALFLSIYPSFYHDAADMQKLLQGYPEPVKKALGLSGMDFASLVSFYSYIFVYILLCGAIQAMNLGTSILSKEVREKTADFLLTKPVTRSSIMTAKLLAAVTSILITNVLYVLCATILASFVKLEEFNMTVFLMISATLLFVQLVFLALGVFVSVVVPKIKSVISVSLGTVFTFFFISMFSSVIGDRDMRYITPFQYFNTTYISQHSSYETSYVLVALGFIVVAICASYIIYSKKDIHSV